MRTVHCIYLFRLEMFFLSVSYPIPFFSFELIDFYTHCRRRGPKFEKGSNGYTGSNKNP